VLGSHATGEDLFHAERDAQFNWMRRRHVLRLLQSQHNRSFDSEFMSLADGRPWTRSYTVRSTQALSSYPGFSLAEEGAISSARAGAAAALLMRARKVRAAQYGLEDSWPNLQANVNAFVDSAQATDSALGL